MDFQNKNTKVTKPKLCTVLFSIVLCDKIEEQYLGQWETVLTEYLFIIKLITGLYG